jgi:hypothetical protein
MLLYKSQKFNLKKINFFSEYAFEYFFNKKLKSQAHDFPF